MSCKVFALVAKRLVDFDVRRRVNLEIFLKNRLGRFRRGRVSAVAAAGEDGLNWTLAPGSLASTLGAPPSRTASITSLVDTRLISELVTVRMSSVQTQYAGVTRANGVSSSSALLDAGY